MAKLGPHRIPLFLLALLAIPAAGLARAETLSIDAYLSQVERANPAYRSNVLDSEGAQLTSRQASLLFRPQAFTKARYTYDTRDTHAPALEGDRRVGRSLSLGLRQQTSFGLQLQLSLDLDQETLLGTSSPLVTRPDITNLYPVPLFNLSLWQNLGGRRDRANERMLEAQSRAEALGRQFAARAALTQAEGTYWKLAVLREAIRLQQASAARAQELYQLEARKARRHLIDSDELLVGESALLGKQLELRSYLAEERSAALAFNSGRGIESDSVTESLELPSPEQALALPEPERKGTRGDVLAAEEQMLASEAGHEMAREKLLPELSLYGSIFAVGVNFSVPIDQGSTRAARDGYARESEAAELDYHSKLVSADEDWKKLEFAYADLKGRLRLALRLEDVQKRKYEATLKRRAHAQAVAYQVFQSELDYLTAQQTRLQLEGDLLGTLAEMRLKAGGA